MKRKRKESESAPQPSGMVAPEGHRKDRRVLMLSLLLGVLTFLAFSRCISHEFINFDDNGYVTSNPHVKKGLSSEGIRWAFTQSHAANWHPVTWISHMLDCEIFGLNPKGHHLVNILIHAANTILLFLLLHRLVRSLWPAFLIAAVFGWHPLRVESVAWVAERKDVLSGFFALVTIWLYWIHLARRSRAWLAGSCLAYAIGLMAKPMLVTLPFVLLLLDYWPLNRISIFSSNNKATAREVMRMLVEKVPFFILTLISCIITFQAQKGQGAMGSLEGLPLGPRIANAVISYGAYLWKLIWPFNLAPFYPHADRHFSWVGFIGAALAFLIITGFVCKKMKTHPYLTVGWFWYLGMLVPVIGLIQVGAQSMADRYTYLPMIGVTLAIFVWTFERLGRSKSQPSVPLVGLVIISLFWIRTLDQTRHWKSSISLWEHTIRVTRNNHQAHNSLGVAYMDVGKLENAELNFRKSVELKPDYVDGLLNLGILHIKKGQIEEGIRVYQQALEFRPGDPKILNNLGLAFARIQKYEQAMSCYQEAILQNSEYAQAWLNLGVALAEMRRFPEAIEKYRESIRLDPTLAPAYNNLGNALAEQGLLGDAIQAYSRAIDLNPQYSDAHTNLGLTYAQLSNWEKAIVHCQEAVRLNPDLASAHFNLGMVLVRTGQKERGRHHLSEAVRISPSFQEAVDALTANLK